MSYNRLRGLREQIRDAKTSNDIDELLKVAYTFEEASKKTKRRWNRSAKERLKELTLTQDNTSKKVKKKSKKTKKN